MSQKYDFIPMEYLAKIDWNSPKDYVEAYQRYAKHALEQHFDNISRAETDLNNMKEMTKKLQIDIDKMMAIAKKLI